MFQFPGSQLSGKRLANLTNGICPCLYVRLSIICTKKETKSIECEVYLNPIVGAKYCPNQRKGEKLTLACTILPLRVDILRTIRPVELQHRFVVLEVLLLRVDFYICNPYGIPETMRHDMKTL